MKKTENNKNNILREIKGWIVHLAMAFGIVLFLTSEVFALTGVKGSSMENTFVEGEKLFLNKLSYNFSSPERGDIIVFLQGEVNKGIGDRLMNVLEDIKMNFERNPRRNRYIKRVIGIPGDKIDMKDGKVYVNDKLLEEEYIKGITSKNALEYPVTVPKEKLFVMGDNREHSADSRIFGFVDYRSVEGKVSYKLWPVASVD